MIMRFEGTRCSFGKKIKTWEGNIYKIYEVMTLNYVLF